MKRNNQGFSLIELLIVLVILGILAAVAIPSYRHYMAKANFADVIQAAQSVKTAVDVCILKQKSEATCDGGSYGIPANHSTSYGNVASLSVAAGVITATAITGENGLNGETYVLTPSVSTHADDTSTEPQVSSITWTATSSFV